MKKYDIIIIGCGISCLYFLFLCRAHNLRVCILEKSSRIGGRIHSVSIDQDEPPIETGALRFNKNHTLLLKLLHRYNIAYAPFITNINVQLNKELECKFRKFLVECKKKCYNYQTFANAATNYFTESEYIILKKWYGYNERWDESNCACLAQQIMIDDADQYYHVPSGLTSLVEALYMDLSQCPNYEFFMNEKVIKIADNNNIYTNSGNHYTAEHIILACPNIEAIAGLDAFIPLLKSVGRQKLNRIYAKFRDGSWFPKRIIHASTTIQQIIPVSANVIMISYSTGNDAKFWIDSEINGTLWTDLEKQLRTIFPNANLERPIWIKQNYWNAGTHYYRPNFIPKRTQSISFKPTQNNIHIIGEQFSLQQGWINGALQNARTFYMKYCRNDFHIEPRYKMAEIRRHNTMTDAWIVLYGNVYNITDWVKIHPGGEIIKYGLGKDATDIFKRVGHQDDALEYINKYYIGVVY
jgi:monoamine oxidase